MTQIVAVDFHGPIALTSQHRFVCAHVVPVQLLALSSTVFALCCLLSSHQISPSSTSPNCQGPSRCSTATPKTWCVKLRETPHLMWCGCGIPTESSAARAPTSRCRRRDYTAAKPPTPLVRWSIRSRWSLKVIALLHSTARSPRHLNPLLKLHAGTGLACALHFTIYLSSANIIQGCSNPAWRPGFISEQKQNSII